MIRVTVTGSECTGKTTLARALAAHYQTVWVPEYVRQFVDERQRAPRAGDLEAIVQGQIELETRLLAEASRLLVLDTDLLSTALYSRHYFGECPDWLEQAVSARASDLYLLAGIDVPWIPDGQQRDRGDRRDEMQALFRHDLESRGLEYLEIRGSEEARLATAISAIDGMD